MSAIHNEWERQYEGWVDRCRSLALFDAVVSVKGMYAFPGFDLRALALALLTFVLNSMLENQPSTEADIEEHLRALLTAKAKVEPAAEEVARLRRALLDRLQNGGEWFTESFMDLRPEAARGEEISFQFHLLESYFAQVRGRGEQVALRLSTEGLDLLFKTKELHRELGISIAQLLFRQQISRGIFDGALNTLRELRLEVQHRIDEIEELNNQIFRAVERVPTYQVSQMWERTKTLTNRERETFTELKDLVNAARGGLDGPSRTEQESRTLDKLWQIDQRLSDVIRDHSAILRAATEVTVNHQETLRRAVSRSLMTTISLEREVLMPVATGEVPPGQLIYWIAPLIQPRIRRHLNPLRAFEPQFLARQGEREEEEALAVDADQIRASEERHKAQVRAMVEELVSYLTPIIDALEHNESTTLNAILSGLAPGERQRILLERRFSYLLLYLHQESGDLRLADLDVVDGMALAEDFPERAALQLLMERHPQWRRLGGLRLRAPEDRMDRIPLPDSGSIPNFRVERVSRHE